MANHSSLSQLHASPLFYVQLIEQIRNGVTADLRIDKRSNLPHHDDDERQCNSALYTDILMVRNGIKECLILTLASVKSTVLFSRHGTVATADPATAVTYCTYTSLLLTRGADDHFLSLPRDVHDILHSCRLSQEFEMRGENRLDSMK